MIARVISVLGRCFVTIGLGICCSSHSAAQVPVLQISPVLIQLAPGEMTTTLSVTNVGAQTTTVQLRPFSWKQTDGADTLAPTDDLVVSPPITEIDGSQSQVFRIVLRTPPNGNEASYRLVLDQLPPAAQPGVVRIALRLSIPVFASAGSYPASRVVWHIGLDGGRTVLIGSNEGSRHVRVLNPVLSDMAQPDFHVEPQHGPYILPGVAQSWTIRDAERLRPGTALRLTARSDAGPIDTTVNVAAR